MPGLSLEPAGLLGGQKGAQGGLVSGLQGGCMPYVDEGLIQTWLDGPELVASPTQATAVTVSGDGASHDVART